MRKLPSVSRAIGANLNNKEDKYAPPLKMGAALIIVTMSIVIFGITMLFSTTSGSVGTSLLVKQVTWITIGIITAAMINIIGYKNILPYSKYFLIMSCILLVVARFSKPINGAHRWIHLGGLGNIQPSEFAKISLILFLAYYLPKNHRQITKSFKKQFPIFLIIALVAGLIMLGNDLGTTVLLLLICWLMLIINGVKLSKLYLFGPVICAPIAIIFIKFFDKMRWARITSFMNPEIYQQTIGYQLWFSILALGSGSWTGLGFAHSRMKAQYLPESHTDFILSIVGEELGFITILIVIAAYITFLIISAFITSKARDKEGKLLGLGITSMIIMQAIINLGVVSGAFPTKGMPAPFISYGGSNMVVCLIGIGFLLSIASFREKIDQTNISSANLRNM